MLRLFSKVLIELRGLVLKVSLLAAVLLFLLSIPLMVSAGPFVFGLAVTLVAPSLLSR